MARASGMPLIRSRLVTVKEADIGQGQGHGQQQGQQRYLGDPLYNGVAPQGYIFIEWMHPFAISLYAAWLERIFFSAGLRRSVRPLQQNFSRFKGRGETLPYQYIQALLIWLVVSRVVRCGHIVEVDNGICPKRFFTPVHFMCAKFENQPLFLQRNG